jgi:aminoglycoside 6'-N-acetyltransferase
VNPHNRDGVTLRPLAEADLPLVSRWLGQPHVAHWWRDPADLESVRAQYRPCLSGADPTEVFVIEVAGQPAGLIQQYLVADEPEWARAIDATGAVTGSAAGIDYLIGEPAFTGHGHGTAAISVITARAFGRYPDADVVVAAPQQANVASWRALERAGYQRWWSGQLDSDDPGDAGPAYLYGIRRPG